MRSDPLFREVSFSAVLDAQHIKMREKIDGLAAEYILNVDEEELSRSLASDFNIDVPRLDVASRTIEQREEKQCIRGDFDFVEVMVNVYTVRIPFNGDAALFRFSPNLNDYNPPRAAVDKDCVRIVVEQRPPDATSLRREIEDTTRRIEKYLLWIDEMAAPFNAQLADFARQCVQYRKKKLGEDINVLTEVGIPIRQRGSIPTSMSIPVRRKPIPLPQRKPPPSPRQPDPTLSSGAYEQILKTMADMALVIERNPTAFEHLSEEQIRFQFLIPLNALYEGDATAETFSYKGKTDIQIRHQGKPIFTAECKFWTGQKALLETVNQLLGYTTWRDTKAAILIFNRNKRFTQVLEQIERTLQKHERLVRWDGRPNETEFRCILKHPDDDDRHIMVTTLAFDVP